MISNCDVVVVGSGVSGLVASNYLCAAGYTVVLIEQHYAVGGCCSYFRKKGFTFDCGAHSLGSFREGGQLSRVFRELDISTTGFLDRAEISDTIITDQGKYNFYSDHNKTLAGLKRDFSDQSDGIDELFKTIEEFDINNQAKYIRYYVKYGKDTFSDFVERYINSAYLRGLLYSFLGNSGLPAKKLWALSGIAMFREFILDGGYFFKGGMETFVKLLSSKFEARGGILLLRKRVERIHIDGNEVNSVTLSDGSRISTKAVITTSSPFQVFNKMLSGTNLTQGLMSKLKKSQPSMSSVVCHFAIKDQVLRNFKLGRTVWYSPNNSSDYCYESAVNGGVDESAETLLFAIPSLYDKTLAPEKFAVAYAFIAASYRDPDYWIKNKATIGLNIIKRLNRLIPGFMEAIVFHQVATPMTIERYTLNDCGAMYGLASNPNQSKQNYFSGNEMGIGGLFGAGHWYTSGAGQGGTPMVAYSGRVASNAVDKYLRTTNLYSNTGTKL